jgi:vitamin B12 transporter
MPRCLTLLLLLVLAALPAHAVIVRGKVTTQLGAPLAGARVQLIDLSAGTRSAADTISGFDGTYELRSDLAGRFLLLTSPSMLATQFAPQIGNAFYGGRTDLLHIDIALDAQAITPQSSAQPMLLETPLRQLADQPAQVAADQLLTVATVLPELRPTLDAFVVQLGQTGAPAELYLRGAPVTRTEINGVAIEQLGGRFNLETLTSAALAAISSRPAVELTPGANPLHFVDAQSGILSASTPVASTLHPVLTLVADAGNLSTTRYEGVGSIVHSREDALFSFARFTTDNDVPAQRIHLITSAANLGYHISANTSLRATLRDDVDAAPLPSPFAFYGVAPATRLGEQNLYGSATFETSTAGGWHNLLRYGLVRERSQAFDFVTPLVGLPGTITGANGYSASGSASFLPLPQREDAVTNRDEYMYQTDYPVSRSEKYPLTALLTAQVQDERAADLTAVQPLRLERTHIAVAASFQGSIRHRFFYETSGFLDHSSTSDLSGSPRIGLTFVPVRPGPRRFRGTSLHLTAATGDREPSIIETAQLGNITPRSRTFDASVDQSILSRKLTLRAAYFHNQFSHQVETLNLAPLTLSGALAYRTQGLEAALRYTPARRFLLNGGYTYLAALTERSAAAPVFNPNLPGIAIGAATALAGARPFERPPSTGFVDAEFTGSRFTASLKSTFAGRSDDSTRLILNPTLLLPNRNLSPSYESLDASVTYNVTHAVIFYSQLSNLLDERHIAPVGYVSTPFAARLGLRIRLGHE